MQLKDSFAVLTDLIFSARLTQFFYSGVIFKFSVCLFVAQKSTFANYEYEHRPVTSGDAGRAKPPHENFSPPPGKMCWLQFENIGHSLKQLGSSQNTLILSWCPKLVTVLMEHIFSAKSLKRGQLPGLSSRWGWVWLPFNYFKVFPQNFRGFPVYFLVFGAVLPL